jgi:hypothetical protein
MRVSKICFSLTLAAGLLAGCAHGPEAVEDDYGNSVRHMMQAQTANPAAPADSEALDHGDGVRLNNAVEGWRKDVANREEVRQDIVINVGGEQSR